MTIRITHPNLLDSNLLFDNIEIVAIIALLDDNITFSYITFFHGVQNCLQLFLKTSLNRSGGLGRTRINRFELEFTWSRRFKSIIFSDACCSLFLCLSDFGTILVATSKDDSLIWVIDMSHKKKSYLGHLLWDRNVRQILIFYQLQLSVDTFWQFRPPLKIIA